MRRGIFGGWPVRPDAVAQAEVDEQTAASDQTAITIEDRRAAGPPPGPPGPPPPERELWPWLLALLVLVLVGLGVVYLVTRDDKSPPRRGTRTTPVHSATVPTPSGRVTVPRLVGLTAPVALTQLQQLGLAGATRNVPSPKPANVVVAQKPGAARHVAKGETVMLTVSKGLGTVAVPDVVGQQVGNALSTLHVGAFKSRVVRVPSAERAGQVMAQAPRAGAKARPGAAVRLNVSDGSKQAPSTGKASTPTTTIAAAGSKELSPSTTTAARANASPLVRVPDLEGKRLLDTRRLVRRIGLVIEVRRVPNAKPLGTVIGQAKKPGTEVKRGTHLLVTVSKGRKPSSSETPPQSAQSIAIPDVTGEDEISATQDLESAGFTVQAVDRGTPDTSQDGLVIEQIPAANQPAQPNSTVTIYVGRYTNA